ncbi:MAG TPA: HAD-IIB family hydrolase [Nitrososphaeraceae archaeon]|nr:HAD-IIB family hydrolase [Nitrososphaeraceae archaeon]
MAAILSDFDGTLCPTSGIKYNYNSSDFIPSSIEDILCEISLTIPIAIITSKDFDFIYPKTRKFAKILSCILGLEMFVLDDRQQINHNKNILNENKKVSTEDIAIKDRISLFDPEMLSINSHMLNEIAANLEKNYHTMNVEKKFLKDKENLLGGITLDWRHNSDWMVNKEKYKETVKESVYSILNSVHQKEDRISKENSSLYTQHLFIQEYSTHPFIDVYVTKLNKGSAFDSVVSKLYEIMDIKGKIIYLGDSENDNPAFRKADISIGVNSDNRLNPTLDCTYSIKYENLSIFLRRLVDNDFYFSESLLNF